MRNAFVGKESLRRSDGFALIASLVILLALAVLGLSGMFLTNMNLKIAENGRSGAIARFNAEAGLDSAFVVLSGAFKENLAIPATLAEFRSEYPSFETAEYAFAPSNGYTVFADGSVRIRIVGNGPNGARYEAEALAIPQLTPVPGDIDYSIFREGFVARQDINMNGNGTFDINFWSGGNITLNAATLKAGRTAAAAGSTCKVKNGTCLTNQPAPDVPLPSFSALRTQVLGLVIEEYPSFTLAGCDFRSGSVTLSNTVICGPAGGHLTISGNVTNLTVIGDESTRVTINAVAGSTTDDGVNGVTVVSGTIDFGSGAAFYGTNTIVAKNNMEFGTNVISHDEVARTFIVTEGDFTLSGTGATDMLASFWVGGTFTVNGTPDRFKGTVVSNRTIVKNGGGSFHTITTPEALDNPLVPEDAEPVYVGSGVRVISRR